MQTEQGLSLGPGPFVDLLENATKQKATVIGKPEPLFFEMALAGVPADESVMIGDDFQEPVCK